MIFSWLRTLLFGYAALLLLPPLCQGLPLRDLTTNIPTLTPVITEYWSSDPVPIPSDMPTMNPSSMAYDEDVDPQFIVDTATTASPNGVPITAPSKKGATMPPFVDTTSGSATILKIPLAWIAVNLAGFAWRI